jgi:hypothetical protein
VTWPVERMGREELVLLMTRNTTYKLEKLHQLAARNFRLSGQPAGNCAERLVIRGHVKVQRHVNTQKSNNYHEMMTNEYVELGSSENETERIRIAE